MLLFESSGHPGWVGPPFLPLRRVDRPPSTPYGEHSDSGNQRIGPLILPPCDLDES